MTGIVQEATSAGFRRDRERVKKMADPKPSAESTRGTTGADSGESSLEDMNLQESGERGLEGINLQGIDQHQSKGLQWLANLTKKISDTSGSIITGGGGGGGGPGKKTVLGIAAAVLFLGIAAFVAVRFLVPGTTTPDPGPPQAVNLGTPAVNMPVAGPLDKPVGWPPNPCGLQFENPTGPEGIPLSGPLDVQWSSFPGAASYEFRVIPPEGAGNPWLIATDGTSKKIYMENFPAAGQHAFAVTALDRGGTSLCSLEVTFDKPDTGEEAKRVRDSEEGGEAVPGACYGILPC